MSGLSINQFRDGVSGNLPESFTLVITPMVSEDRETWEARIWRYGATAARSVEAHVENLDVREFTRQLLNEWWKSVERADAKAKAHKTH